MDNPRKIIVTIIDDCLKCPKWMKCSPSKKLTPEQRFAVKFTRGLNKFILKGCPLDDAPVIDKKQ